MDMNKHVKTIGGEQYVSPTGVVLMALYAWRVDHKEQGREMLQRYCQYLSMHGYGMGATALYTRLSCMPDWQAMEWIESTYTAYVSDPMAAMEYVTGETVQCL